MSWYVRIANQGRVTDWRLIFGLAFALGPRGASHQAVLHAELGCFTACICPGPIKSYSADQSSVEVLQGSFCRD